MSFWLNGYKVNTDFSAFTIRDQFELQNRANASGRSRRTDRSTAPSDTFNAEFMVSTTDIANIIEVVQGIAKNADYILIESDTQYLQGTFRSLYVKLEAFEHDRPAGFPYLTFFRMSGTVIGSPSAEGGSAAIAHFWNEKPIAGTGGYGAYFPWSEGGRQGLVANSSEFGIDWTMDSANRLTIVKSPTATIAVTKDVTGTGVLQFTTTASSNENIVAINTATYTNGFFSTRFKCSSTVNSGGLLYRLSSLADSSTGYRLLWTNSGALTLYRKTGVATYASVDGDTIATLFDGKWHTVGVYVHDSTHVVIVDGIVKLVLTDAVYGSAGYMGMYVSSDASGTGTFSFGPVAQHPGTISTEIPLDSHTEPITDIEYAAHTTSYRPVGPNLLGLDWTQNTIVPSVGSTLWDSNVIRTSLRTLQFYGTATGRNVAINITSLLSPGKTYIAEAWFKRGFLSGATDAGTPGIQVYNSNVTSIDSNTTFSGLPGHSIALAVKPGTWRRTWFIFTPHVLQAGDTTSLYIYGMNTGAVNVADVSIREVVPVTRNVNDRKIVSGATAG